MSSKVAVVTGSNKGLGLAIVKALCQQFQGVVYITSRDIGRGKEAVETLVSEGLKPMFHQLDINDLSSITAAAKYFKEKYGGVDILVNNAGIAPKDPTPFAILAEMTFKTNFFATRDMLTNFLPLVKPGGRVVNVSSIYGSRALDHCSPALQERFRSEDLSEEELVGLMERYIEETKRDQHKQGGWPVGEHIGPPYKAFGPYELSKTGVTALSVVLARQLSKERQGDKILLNACCPGSMRTDMAGPKAPKSPEEGAETPVYLALLPPDATEPHGRLVSDKQVQPW